MATEKQLIEQRLRERLYEARRAENEILFVEVDEMALLLGIPLQSDVDMDTARLGEGQRMALILRDRTEEITQPYINKGNENHG
jgi:hypothetical protein